MDNLFVNKFPIPWSMTRAEKSTLIQLVKEINPEISIEIGTFNGGSLQVLSHYSKKVYAIDITPEYRDARCKELKNVDFLIGDSKKVVPKLIEKINASKEKVEFILIDGDHTTKGVLADITNVLKIIPYLPITIFLHDSFNPNCRKGILSYDYSKNPYVHNVELDYVTGAFNHDGLYREMWGGFGYIKLMPEKRIKPLKVSQYQEKLFKITYYKSIHFYRKCFGFLKPIYKVFKK
ncbi:class I SAM-dependent methyltransferase [Winogradskyella alexanderae]|uniref:Class I SAM-dependent methyltransferase n=1 Tax=Winogradskyella alexanderae TaxID=2877123 RepID=A0ABS7XTL8_9FLAO|nr:class I SAM-dependent methyltransferase [Winogradskyella alexanderae]MCA0132247.1 class I SAM-dependent methyltransferase [Winogradskyella alexanderae]